jgi:tetratricopeptide (TPR) repeat protein
MFYETSLEIDDSQSDAWIGIGVVRDLINEPLEAKKFMSKALRLEPDNAEYQAAFANALVEFDRVPMAVREFKKLIELGKKIEDVDVSFHLYEAAKQLIDSIDVKVGYDRSEQFARQFIPVAIEFAILGLGFSAVEEAMEYLSEE